MKACPLRLALLASSLASGLALPATLWSQGPIRFHYEQSQCLETPSYAQTLEDCRKLAKASPWVRVADFGVSPEGRKLPLVILDRHQAFSPAIARKKGKAVILIQACIHAGEPDGKDAGLLFFRELIETKSPLLDRLTFLFIPIFNVDGHERFSRFNRINQNGPKEMGWRTNGQNLNLNRDFLKCDAPEMRHWLKLFNTWEPDFYFDCHTTDGADYQYDLTYGADTGHFLFQPSGEWLNQCLESLKTSMAHAQFPIFPYVEFKNWHDPRSGLRLGAAPPMLSNGYASARNRPSLLLETHMLKPYKIRVDATLEIFKQCCALLHRDHEKLLQLNRQADQFTQSPDFRKSPLPLAFQAGETHEEVDFLGVEYTIEKSDLTDGEWFKYDPKQPKTFKLPFYNQLKASVKAQIPSAYLIPAAWTSVISRLDAHGIAYTRLISPQTIQARVERFSNITFSKTPSEGRQRIEGITSSFSTETLEIPAGTVAVSTSQPKARVLAHLLESQSPDSLLNWGFFNGIFEQKEYGESYVMEGLAREMLAKNPSLKAEYEALKASDPGFRENAWQQINWFYNRSPWADPQLNRYPVLRVNDPNQAVTLFNPATSKTSRR